MRFLQLISLFLMISSVTCAQGLYRIKGEFSIKSKENDYAQLVMGKFYYDLNKKQIIYRNFFPENESWITSDTVLYHLVNEEIVSSQQIPNLTEFSIFHLALTHNLRNFGIDNKSFILEDVEQDGGMVISTYVPNKKYINYSGKILLSMKEGKLFGIIFYNENGEIIKKQFFEDYILDRGVPFPGKITEVNYDNGTETYKVTTYKNIEYNANEPDRLYYFNPGGL